MIKRPLNQLRSLLLGSPKIVLVLLILSDDEMSYRYPDIGEASLYFIKYTVTPMLKVDSSMSFSVIEE